MIDNLEFESLMQRLRWMRIPKQDGLSIYVHNFSNFKVFYTCEIMEDALSLIKVEGNIFSGDLDNLKLNIPINPNEVTSFWKLKTLKELEEIIQAESSIIDSNKS